MQMQQGMQRGAPVQKVQPMRAGVGQQAGLEPQPKKSRKWLWIAIIVILIGAGVWAWIWFGM